MKISICIEGNVTVIPHITDDRYKSMNIMDALSLGEICISYKDNGPIILTENFTQIGYVELYDSDVNMSDVHEISE